VATAHLNACVRVLAKALHSKDRSLDDYTEGIAGALELIDQPWDFSGDPAVLTWREGYEQCMTDIVEAIADEWGVALPVDPIRAKEIERDGDGQ
jgi:hypothetical protein